MRKLVLGVIRGFVMGAADVVPGVSGGTVAVVLGIYERLLAAARSGAQAAGCAIRGNPRAAWRHLSNVEWLLVLPVVCGIVTAVASLASVIESQLLEHPEEMAGLFCGLVAGSTLAALRLFEWHRAARLTIIVSVASVTFVALGAQAAPTADPSPLMLFGAGAVAICATILPGISGSFVLLMLGMYAAVLNVIDERLWGDAAALGLGVVVGLVLFSTLLSTLLERARNTVMAVLVGLMTGSLRVLWPWPNGVGVIDRHQTESVSGTGLSWPAADEWLLPTLAGLASFATVLLLTRLSSSSNPPDQQPTRNRLTGPPDP